MAEMRIRGRQAFVGRDQEADLVVSDPRISRRHAVIRIAGNDATLEVLPTATRDGLVRRNGAIVARGVPEPLASGDALTFGSSPEYRVTFGRQSLVLAWSDQTERAPAELDLRIAVHPVALLPPDVAAAFEVAGDVVDLDDESVDAAIIVGPADVNLLARLDAMRSRRFFLPQIFIGAPLPSRRTGDAYVEIERDEPRVAERVRAVIEEIQGREQAALPFHTGGILHVDEDLVMAHDWVASRPRSLELSELQQQVLWVLAMDRQAGGHPAGLGVNEVAERLERRRWARALHTIANELSARLPRQLVEVGLHPGLWSASGTREKRYGLSTPASCIRSSNRSQG